jgi:flagella basal body P-ring formation protein FlgA
MTQSHTRHPELRAERRADAHEESVAAPVERRTRKRRLIRGTAAAASLTASLFAAASALSAELPSVEGVQQTAAAPIALKPQVTVDSDLVLLGDLFHGELAKADVPIARAPGPGERVELQAQWLWSVAKAYGVDWRPRSTLETVTLSRQSYLLDAAAAEGILLDELALRGRDPASLSVQLDNPRFAEHLPTGAAGRLDVAHLEHDPRSGRFAATLRAPAGAEGRTVSVSLTGRLQEIVEVPVLTRRVAKDAVIGRNDIEWMAMPAERVAGNVVTDAEALIGSSPRRGIRPGTPVRVSEIGAPRLVDKNQMVLLRVQTPTMQLTAQGRAMESGARGEQVRVLNTSSNTVVTGTVAGNGLVMVRPLIAQIGN